jgi:hypothetical protein
MPDRLGTFSKTPAERKRYSIYYGDWLDAGETILSSAFAVTPVWADPVDLEIDAWSIDTAGQTLVFFANAGVDGLDYSVLVTSTSSGGQIKEDEVVVMVRDF